MTVVELRFAVLRVYPAKEQDSGDRIRWADGRVETHFPDGRVAIAARDLRSGDNRENAVELGYTDGSDGVWRALVEHELLHSLISDYAWSRASRVLRHEAGADVVPYHERIYEESIVLAWQRVMRLGVVDPALQTFEHQARYWRPSIERWISLAMAEA